MIDGLMILLPASDIPAGSTVTKRTGDKEYILRDRITAYGENGKGMELTPDAGMRFMVDPTTGNANIISGDKIICWKTDRYELQAHLEALEDDGDHFE